MIILDKYFHINTTLSGSKYILVLILLILTPYGNSSSNSYLHIGHLSTSN